MDLKQVKTENLVNELIQRGAQKIIVGPYKDYSLQKKYSNDRSEIEGQILLLVEAR